MKAITKFHKRDSVEKIMFGWVHSLRVNISCSVESALKTFIKYNELDEKEFNIKSLAVTYNRMVKEYYGEQKTQDEQSQAEQSPGTNS